jgi:hypothetical protein
MFLAFRKDGAKDWISNLAISISHSGKQHKLQFHHIFAQALLKGRHRPRVINDIANLSFIGGKTNRRISSKPPAEYLPELIEKQGQAPFLAQCIPLSDRVTDLEKYTDFLAERRRMIAERLNRFLDDARAISE